MVEKSKFSFSESLRGTVRGDRESMNRVFAQVHGDLRRMAQHSMRNEAPGHTLQPTALVNELYVKLAGGEHCTWRDRAHFVALGARAMRQILVDHARAKKAAKRGGSAKRETLSVAHVGAELSTIDILDLHEALEELSKLSARQAQVAELRFFGGLQLREVGEVLSIAESTVKDHRDVAKVWLKKKLERTR